MKVRSLVLALLALSLVSFGPSVLAEESADASSGTESAETAADTEDSGSERASVTNQSGTASLDLTGLENGTLKALYSGDSEAAQVQVIAPGGQVTPYAMVPGEETILSLAAGAGTYRINVLEKAGGEQYAVIFSHALDWDADNELSPFLQPNSYVFYHEGSECTEAARGIWEAVNEDPSAFVKAVYDYVIANIRYDEDLAADVSAEYVPDPDRTIESGTGICLDYASLMAAMLRSCGIPARIVAGNFGAYYHAWVLVSEEVPSDGRIVTAPWRMYDPTLGASNSAASVQKLINNQKDAYIAKYVY